MSKQHVDSIAIGTPPNRSSRGPAIQRVSLDEWQRRSVELCDAGSAVLIEAAVRPEDLLQWSPANVVERWGEIEVDVALGLPQHGVPYAGTEIVVSKARFRDFVSRLETGESGYMSQASHAMFPGMIERTPIGSPPGAAVHATNLWIGARTRSGMHFDYSDNLFVQLSGTKRVILSPTNIVRNLRPFNSNWTKSQIDFEDVDVAANNSGLKNTKLISFDVRPGDALYIPRGWWHYLATDELSVSVNIWFGQFLPLRRHVQRFLSAGPRVWARTAYDFGAFGLLGKPYEILPFSGPPLGFQIAQGLGVARKTS